MDDVQKTERIAEIEQAIGVRLSPKRLAHSISVADMASSLASIYGADEFDARVAGLLHDWDKHLSYDELISRMEDFGITIPDQPRYLAAVLHSFTGAEAVRCEFPWVSEAVTSAIRNHTLGSPDATLNEILFIADNIEPLKQSSESFDCDRLRVLVGKVTLDELYFQTYAETMGYLARRNRPIHPMVPGLWNELLEAKWERDGVPESER